MCPEMNQSDKPEPNPRRTLCSSRLIPVVGSTGSPWVTAEFPWSVRNEMDLAGRVPVHLLPRIQNRQKGHLGLGFVFQRIPGT